MSELESVEDVGTYDSPEQSVAKDFGNINEADCFMLLHPRKMQMSSFIKLGYADALGKTALIIAHPENLPYMALGLNNEKTSVLILNPDDKNLKKTITEILADWEKQKKE